MTRRAFFYKILFSSRHRIPIGMIAPKQGNTIDFWPVYIVSELPVTAGFTTVASSVAKSIR